MIFSKKQAGFSFLKFVSILAVLIIALALYTNHQKQQKKEAQLAEVAIQQKKEIQLKIDVENAELKIREDQMKKADQYSQTLKAVDGLYQKWNDGIKLASSVGRIALAQPVGNLQTLKTEAANMQIPPCLDQAKADLIEGMRLYTDGFLAFMQNEMKLGSEFAQLKFDQAKPHIQKFEEARKACPQS